MKNTLRRHTVCRAAIFLLLLLFFLLLPCISSARTVEASNEKEPGFDEEDFLSMLPEEYREIFTDGEGGFSFPDLQEFLSLCMKILSGELSTGGGSVANAAGMILIGSLFTLLEKTLRERHASSLLRLVLLSCGAVIVFSMLSPLLSAAQSHLSSVIAFVSRLLPLLTGAVVAMGGVSTASVSSIGLQLSLSFISETLLGVLLPLIKITAALEFVFIVCDNQGLFAFVKTLRRTFLTVLGGVTTLILTVFAFQSVIAARTDSVTLRAFRYTAGSLVPMVGAAVSESAKTLLSGLDLIKTTLGAAALFVLLLMLLPILAKLLVGRFSFLFLGTLADAVENKEFSALFHCAFGFSGALVALTAIADLMLIVSFAITATVSLS